MGGKLGIFKSDTDSSPSSQDLNAQEHDEIVARGPLGPPPGYYEEMNSDDERGSADSSGLPAVIRERKNHIVRMDAPKKARDWEYSWMIESEASPKLEALADSAPATNKLGFSTPAFTITLGDDIPSKQGKTFSKLEPIGEDLILAYIEPAEFISTSIIETNMVSEYSQEQKQLRVQNPSDPDAEYRVAAADTQWTTPSAGGGKFPIKRFPRITFEYLPEPTSDSDEEKSQEDETSDEQTNFDTTQTLVIMGCKEEGKQFTDIEFPPAENDDEQQQQHESVAINEWRRPTRVFADGRRVLFGKISERAVHQGAVADCYLLVGLACLAQKPSRIHKLLPNIRLNKWGVLAVDLCLSGVWESVLLDDRLPCNSTGELLYCHPESSSSRKYQLWPMMIEKAWAKVHGGYSNINEGLIDEALHDLTGAPTSYVFIKDHTADIHWTIISEAIEKGWMLTCGTRDFKSCTSAGAFEIMDDDGELRLIEGYPEKGLPGNQRILKLFNPWSRRGQYKGDWCDSYKGWTARLRKELQQTESTNSKGIFYISLESFIKYFYSYVVCYYEDDFQYSSEKFESSPTEPTVLSFELPKAGDYYITVSQMNSRMFRESDNYSYSTVAMVIARAKSDGSYDYKCSTNKTDKDVWLKVECRKPGKYVCCILTPWQSISNTFGFSIYGPEQISEIVQRDTSAGEKLLGQLMMVRAAKKTAESKNFAEYGHPDIGFAVQHASNGLGYIFLDNNSADTQLTANIFIKESKNTIFYPVAKKNRFEVVLGPKRQKIIVYQMCGQAAQLRFQERFHFVSDFKKNSQFVRTKGTRIPRLLADGSDVGVSLYTLKKDDVQILFFENHSDQHFYSETVHLTLQNAKIAASDATSLVVDLKPRRCRYVVVRKADKHAKPFSVEVAKSEAAVFVPKDT